MRIAFCEVIALDGRIDADDLERGAVQLLEVGEHRSAGDVVAVFAEPVYHLICRQQITFISIQREYLDKSHKPQTDS